jgi:hypothetical protein
MIDFESLRNTSDKPTMAVTEEGLTPDGLSDVAIAEMTGSYPPGQHEYSQNLVSDMEITLLSGAGKLMVRSSKMHRVFHLEPEHTTKVTIPKGTDYFYSAAPGETLQFSMTSTPAWSPDQYKIRSIEE